MRKQASRRALYGWIFYTPPVAFIIGVLAFDAYLNIETRRNDYEVNALKRRATELNDALEKLRSGGAKSHQLNKLQEQALSMGLREPEPWQIERIVMPNSIRPASDFQVARVIPQPPVMPKRDVPSSSVTPELPLSPAPAPTLPSAPDTMVLAEAPVKLEPLELPMLDEVPSHVAQLEQPAAGAEAPEAHQVNRAPLAPLAGMDAEIPTRPAPQSLDESVESMLAL
jgi:hypothetical protein